ncbi:MAG: N-methyl-L-tryptophan oxidase [Deltaproteobacteria bacterium]|nr:N-methyl-L-tryptophan oxidase [Deltaproteobacteria bacterium]
MVYDVIVAGLGGMGSATAWQLAKKGHSVLGIERFAPSHDQGSSHGDSRIIRLAYFEDPAYVPLLKRAYELWNEAEIASGEDLFTETGGLMIGPNDSKTVAGALRSAQEWDLGHQMLSYEDMRERFPQFILKEDEIALFEERAGFVRPERSCSTHNKLAEHSGGEMLFGEQFLSWRPDGDGVQVVTDKGTYRANRLVVSGGSWNPKLLVELEIPMEVKRLTLFWFDVENMDQWQLGRMPIYIWEPSDIEQFYGFPAIDGPDGGAKVAYFRLGPECDPDKVDRTVRPEEVEQIRQATVRLNKLTDAPLRTATCLYTNTPDEHFVIGLHPEYPQVSLAAGFSGHGFKFASVIGEVMSDLAIQQSTEHPISLFSPTRFRN